MIMKTDNFGDIEVCEDKVIDFSAGGIFGFEAHTRFVFLSDGGEGDYLHWLQSVDAPDVCFPLIDPRIVRPDYVVEVDDMDMEGFPCAPEDVVYVMSVLVIPDEVNDMTVNLKAPILINETRKAGRQVVVEDKGYSVRQRVFEEGGKAAEGAVAGGVGTAPDDAGIRALDAKPGSGEG